MLRKTSLSNSSRTYISVIQYNTSKMRERERQGLTSNQTQQAALEACWLEPGHVTFSDRREEGRPGEVHQYHDRNVLKRDRLPWTATAATTNASERLNIATIQSR